MLGCFVNLLGGTKSDYLPTKNHLQCWWRLLFSDLNNFVSSSLLILESAKFSFGMTLPWALVEKTAQGWNSLFSWIWPCFRAGLSLCAAILMELNSRENLLQWTFRNFCNLSWLILEKGGSTPVLANHIKRVFPLKRAFLGESQWPVRRLSNQISSLKLEAHYFALRAINSCVTL